MARLNYPKISPEGFQKMSNVAMHVANSGLDMKLVHMVYLRTSQINGCPYCIDLHWHDATKLGVEARKLNAVIFFRDAPWFDEKERAALDWAECVTRTVDQTIMQKSYETLLTHFTEKEAVDLTYAICQMNAFNRLGVAFHAVPKG